MKSKIDLLIWVVLGIVLFFFGSNTYQAARNLTIRVSDFPRNVRNENGALKLDLPFVIVNPLRGYFRVSSLALTMYYNGVPIGNVLLPTGVTVSEIETVINPQVQIGYSDLLGVMPQLKTRPQSINIKFIGAVRVFGIALPIQESINITLPKLS